MRETQTDELLMKMDNLIAAIYSTSSYMSNLDRLAVLMLERLEEEKNAKEEEK